MWVAKMHVVYGIEGCNKTPSNHLLGVLFYIDSLLIIMYSLERSYSAFQKVAFMDISPQAALWAALLILGIAWFVNHLYFIRAAYPLMQCCLDLQHNKPEGWTEDDLRNMARLERDIMPRESMSIHKFLMGAVYRRWLTRSHGHYRLTRRGERYFRRPHRFVRRS